ncbi:helix-turn-helix transcriptional regulator [Arcobacter sp.]|uniref:helix-turn-helix transcriptional regulator n=1 Tax=unclassified Arcobacter TaxID=2593671 RepID=UPI003B0064B2
MLQNDEFLTIEQVINLTGYSKQTLANWRSTKEIFPFYKRGRKVLYKKSEIVSIIENGKVELNQGDR